MEKSDILYGQNTEFVLKQMEHIEATDLKELSACN
jgi:hypothetical protein